MTSYCSGSRWSTRLLQAPGPGKWDRAAGSTRESGARGKFCGGGFLFAGRAVGRREHSGWVYYIRRVLRPR